MTTLANQGGLWNIQPLPAPSTIGSGLNALGARRMTTRPNGIVHGDLL